MMVSVRRAVLGVGVALAFTLGLSVAAVAAPPAGNGQGAGLTSSRAPRTVLVPAFATDLPTGTATFSLQGVSSPGARPAVATASWVCSVYASDPWELTTYYIQGDGWQSCAGTGYQQTALKVTVQSYLGLGLWKNRASITSNWSNANWLEAEPEFYCRGIGTYTYRIVTDGWAVYGNYHQAVQSLNYLEVYC